MIGIGQLRIRYDEETGELERAGTYTPKGSRVLAHQDDLIAVHLPGHRYYSGQGQAFRYAPAEHEVYRVEREDGDGWMIVRPVLSWPVRR